MPMPLALLRQLQSSAPTSAWTSLFEHAWNICSAPLHVEKASSEVTKRDAEIGAADLFLATAGWDLWRSYEAVVPRTADVLASWWAARGSGRAVLVLDAMSLREVPWIIKGAAERGYTVHQARATGAELPADTTPFAQALGYASRGSLQNNGGATKGRLSGAATDSTDLPWEDCAAQINASQDWLLWHHWPDARLHDLSAPGHGLAALAREASAEKLSSDAFWTLVHTPHNGAGASSSRPTTATQRAATSRTPPIPPRRSTSRTASRAVAGRRWPTSSSLRPERGCRRSTCN